MPQIGSYFSLWRTVVGGGAAVRHLHERHKQNRRELLKTTSAVFSSLPRFHWERSSLTSTVRYSAAGGNGRLPKGISTSTCSVRRFITVHIPSGWNMWKICSDNKRKQPATDWQVLHVLRLTCEKGKKMELYVLNHTGFSSVQRKALWLFSTQVLKSFFLWLHLYLILCLAQTDQLWTLLYGGFSRRLTNLFHTIFHIFLYESLMQPWETFPPGFLINKVSWDSIQGIRPNFFPVCWVMVASCSSIKFPRPSLLIPNKLSSTRRV